MKELRAPTVALLTASLLLLVICGWLFVWNDDGGGPLPVVMIIGAGQSLVLYGLVVVALTTVVMMRRRPRLRCCWMTFSDRPPYPSARGANAGTGQPCGACRSPGVGWKPNTTLSSGSSPRARV